MNYVEASSIIRSRFETAWAARTQAAMPNAAFDPPAVCETAYVRFSLAYSGAEQVASGDPGNNPRRHYGMTTIEVYAPEGVGDAEIQELTDAAMAVFSGFSSGHLRFRLAPFPRTLGNDRGAYRVNVMAPFEWDGFF